MNPAQILSLKSLCTALGTSIPASIWGMLWSMITFLWPWYWPPIILGLALWIFFEIKTRNGTVHYNSKNGFSPAFNSFVGSGTYLGFQAITYFVLRLIFGDGAYCIPWSYALHMAVFASTAYFLNAIGFWPEIRWQKPRKKGYRFKK